MFDLYIEHKTLRRFHLREQAHVVFPRRTYDEPAKHLYRKLGFTVTDEIPMEKGDCLELTKERPENQGS